MTSILAAMADKATHPNVLFGFVIVAAFLTGLQLGFWKGKWSK